MRRTLKRLNLRLRLLRPGPRRVVLGASGYGQAGWLSTDISTLNLLAEKDWQARFAERSLAALLAEHVWEHLSAEEGALAARRCWRYLRPGGHLRIAVPDGLHPDPAYIAAVRPGGTGPGANDHKLLYTYRSLGELLTSAGFVVRLLEYFDEQGQFHATSWNPADGLVRRSLRFDPRNSGGQPVYTSLIVDALRG